MPGSEAEDVTPSPSKKSQSKSTGEFTREDTLRQIFGNVGELMDDFSCAVESTVLLHGRLYITDRFVCFYSNLFGLEKKIRIPFSHITVVTKENTALVIPNAIAISTFKKQYIFRSFWDRDHCFFMLKSFISKHSNKSNANQNAALKAASKANASSTSVGSGGSSSADSLLLDGPTGAGAGAGAGGGLTAAGRYVLEGSGNSNDNSSDSGTRDNLSSGANRARSKSSISGAGEGDEEHEDEDEDQNFTTHPSGQDKSFAAAGGDRGAGGASGEAGITSTTSASLDERTEFDESAAEQEFVAAAEMAKYKIAIPAGTLPVSVGDFQRLFLADSASHSYSSYHENTGDEEVAATSWENSGSSYTREIKFFKPVNLPGLKSTRGVKLQSLRRYGNAGLILKSSTRLEDVPAADTFSVEDMLVVSRLPQAGAGANGDALSKIEIYFEVKFHKSTFIRWVIDSNTTTEMTKWLTAFQIHITKMSATHIHTRDFKLASIKKVFLTPTKEGGDDGDSSDEEGRSNKDSGKSSGLLKVPKKITKSIKVAATQVQSHVTDSIESWRRVEGRRFIVLCFAMIFTAVIVVYLQVRRIDIQLTQTLDLLHAMQDKFDALGLAKSQCLLG